MKEEAMAKKAMREHDEMVQSIREDAKYIIDTIDVYKNIDHPALNRMIQSIKEDALYIIYTVDAIVGIDYLALNRAKKMIKDMESIVEDYD